MSIEEDLRVNHNATEEEIEGVTVMQFLLDLDGGCKESPVTLLTNWRKSAQWEKDHLLRVGRIYQPMGGERGN